jgi:succinate dehydrogenase / fumarate reductase, flavoprotein subunit
MFNSESANPDRFRQIETSALIIGAGAAGLRTAIELTSNQIPCLVAGKRKHGDAHTRMAAGGINACFGNLDPEDRWQIHAADTLREGHFICQPRSVELLALKAPERVLELSEWGCHFDRAPAGKINQRFFGAQSFRRTCFVGDITGEAVLETLLKKAEALEIPILPDIFISKLIQKEKRMAGAFGFNLEECCPVRCPQLPAIRVGHPPPFHADHRQKHSPARPDAD